MKMACSWCGKLLPPKNGNTTTLETELSHSICLHCMQKMELFDEIDGTSVDNCIQYGQAVIDKNNKIRSYETMDLLFNVDKNNGRGIIGKDYFREFNPALSVKSFKHKLSGLRRRKNDGQLELQYLITDEAEIQFSTVEMIHYKNTGDTVINMKLIQKEDY